MAYWESADLKLYFVTNKDCSIDENAAKRFKKTATAPEQYVTELQKDLIALGYLEDKEAHRDGHFGGGTKRVVTRFQRHAKRVYRMTKAKEKTELAEADRFAGDADGIVTPAVAKEIRNWIDKGWVNPVGYFELEKIEPNDISPNPKLRSDARAAWQAIMKNVSEAGGTLAGLYGDVLRHLSKPTKAGKKEGTSDYSVHYCGRAVDIGQVHYGPIKSKRYVAKKDVVGTRTFWILYCRTEKQDGTQGEKIEKGAFKVISSFADAKETDIPEGHYINLTEMLEAGGFSRIGAQNGWDAAVPADLSDADKKKFRDAKYNKTEWWHFQFNKDLQETFQDELELVGYDLKKINAAGWKSDAELDHAPG
jgi:peptidoglycan hydrolase-like protein with peptidoglycan-binding domain